MSSITPSQIRVHRESLHREIIECAQTQLKSVLKFYELSEQERNVLLDSLSYLRKKITGLEFEISADPKVKEVFEQYVYPAIAVAVEKLIEARKNILLRPIYRSLQEFDPPMKKSSCQKLLAMRVEAQWKIINEVAIMRHMVKSAKQDILFLMRWKYQTERVFEDELHPLE